MIIFTSNLRKVLFLLMTIAFLGCSKNISPNNSNLYVIDSTNQQLVLQIEAIGKNESEAIYNGEIKAMKMLLFYGIPNTIYKISLVSETEHISESNYPNYYQNFYNGFYKNFIVNNQVLSSYKKGGMYSLNLKVTINTTALRKDLENHTIIRKFGL